MPESTRTNTSQDVTAPKAANIGTIGALAPSKAEDTARDDPGPTTTSAAPTAPPAPQGQDREKPDRRQNQPRNWAEHGLIKFIDGLLQNAPTALLCILITLGRPGGPVPEKPAPVQVHRVPHVYACLVEEKECA